MPRYKRTDRAAVSLAEVCRRARVDRKDVQRAFEAIVDAAMDGEEVHIPKIGFFRMLKFKGGARRVPKIPVTADREYVTINVPDAYHVHFRQARSLIEELRRRARGRSIGTWNES